MNDYRFLLSKKWIGLAVFVLILIPLFLLASSWQFHRLSDKQNRNAEISLALAQPVQPLQRVITDSVDRQTEWQRVSASGTFEPSGEVLVRRKFYDNAVGYWVVTPFATMQGQRLLVVRGWIPAGRDALTPPPYTPAPSGEVSIEGRLRMSDVRTGKKPTDLPQGQIDVLVAGEIDARAINGYLEYTGASPADIRPIAPPQLDEGPHWSYAWQWRLFVILALVGFVVLARSNAQRLRQDEAN